MSRLIYSTIMSLDGYIADEAGRFDWAQPDEEVHSYLNDLERDAGTFLVGRRTYEVMLPWESPEFSSGQPPYIQDFAQIWQGAEKVVYSTTLEAPSFPRTRVERVFDPEAVRQLKHESARDLLIGGPTLAAHAISAGLVDECQIFVAPVLVGGGLSAFSASNVALRLLEERSFDSGMVFLRYEVG